MRLLDRDLGPLGGCFFRIIVWRCGNVWRGNNIPQSRIHKRMAEDLGDAFMIQLPWTDLIKTVHRSEYQLVAAVTGGGSRAISQLLGVPGASHTMLEAVVPYAHRALIDWLGGTPDQWCSELTARAMAMAAWMRARQLAPDADPPALVGIGATASLATNRPKRGEHRVHVAAQTASQTTSYSLVLSKGRRDRRKEEWLAAKLLLVAVGEACQADLRAARIALLQQLSVEEPIERRQQAAEAAWTELLLGARQCVVLTSPSAGDAKRSEPPSLIFPGAFHPPHRGHQRMAGLAAARLGQPVAFEISMTNVDKPPLDFIEIRARLDALQQFDREATLLLTDAPTFREKANLFPSSTFIAGADTIVRIGDLRYYDGNVSQRDQAVQEIAERGCRFLVFGRQIEGRFRVLGDLSIPEELRSLCEEVPADEFREDVSSTELRKERDSPSS